MKEKIWKMKRRIKNMSAIIEDIGARQILNSRGELTIEVDIKTESGFGRASAPSGASRGKAEAIPYPVMGIKEAIKKICDIIAPELIGFPAYEQEEIDTILHEIDGTENFRNIGGNSVYAISLAVAEAAANTYGVPLFNYLGGQLASDLPYPLGNVLGGGKHAYGKVPDIQEFLVLPVGASSFLEAVDANIAVHKKLKNLLKKTDKCFTGGRGDEGAWAPNLTNEDAFEIVNKACNEISEEKGFECRFGIDLAASSLWDPKNQIYVYTRDEIHRDSGEQIEYVSDLIERYKLIYVEDPMQEDDFEGHKEIKSKEHDCLICGDDLLVTSVERLKQSIEMRAANAIIIKMNQVGTLTDTWKTTKLAKENGYVPVVSHRSGETTASHIAHLSVAFKCPIIKTGVIGGERIAKLNELIRIEEMLSQRACMSKLKI
jgi:enolase